MADFLTVALLFVGILLIFVILLQRGRGGGLAGAFGGLGGQSAFGTKAGDVFTKITVILAVIWVLLAGIAGIYVEEDVNSRFKSKAEDSISTPESDEKADGEESDGEKSADELNFKESTEDSSEEKKPEADVKPEEDSDKKPAEETSKEETKKEDSATDKKAEEKPSEEKKPGETKVEEKKTEEKK